MTNKISCKPENMAWMIPYLIVSDVKKTIDLYQAAFGFTAGEIMCDEAGVGQHGEMMYKDMNIMFGKPSPELPECRDMKTPTEGKYRSPVCLYVYTEDVNKLYEHITSGIKSGKFTLKLDQDIQDAFWGDRMFAVTDHDGHQWTFATFSGHSACHPGCC